MLLGCIERLTKQPSSLPPAWKRLSRLQIKKFIAIYDKNGLVNWKKFVQSILQMKAGGKSVGIDDLKKLKEQCESLSSAEEGKFTQSEFQACDLGIGGDILGNRDMNSVYWELWSENGTIEWMHLLFILASGTDSVESTRAVFSLVAPSLDDINENALQRVFCNDPKVLTAAKKIHNSAVKNSRPLEYAHLEKLIRSHPELYFIHRAPKVGS